MWLQARVCGCQPACAGVCAVVFVRRSGCVGVCTCVPGPARTRVRVWVQVFLCVKGICNSCFRLPRDAVVTKCCHYGDLLYQYEVSFYLKTCMIWPKAHRERARCVCA